MAVFQPLSTDNVITELSVFKHFSQVNSSKAPSPTGLPGCILKKMLKY